MGTGGTDRNGIRGAGRARRPSRPPPGLYLHVPFCDGKCAYCAFYSVRYDAALADRYLAALERAAAAALANATAGCAGGIGTVYIGGGTPTMLSPAQLGRLGGIVARFSLRARGEWTVEANPGTLTAAKADVLAAAGVNRISLGAQAFDDAVLRRLGRRHRAADTVRAAACARRAGIANLGLDLLAGVPGVGRAAWRDTLGRALDLEPRHVSVYALTREEGTRLDRTAARGDIALPSDDDQLAALEDAEACLAGAGFARYELSNYARPGYACRHNLACWRGADYLGLGPAAASHAGRRRWTDRPDLAAWLAALEAGRNPPRDEEVLTPAIERQDRVVFGLRMAEGVSAGAARGYAGPLRRLRADGLVRLRRGRWRLTRRGRALADYAAVELIGEEANSGRGG